MLNAARISTPAQQPHTERTSAAARTGTEWVRTTPSASGQVKPTYAMMWENYLRRSRACRG
jgi:hypothetical protein